MTQSPMDYIHAVEKDLNAFKLEAKEVHTVLTLKAEGAEKTVKDMSERIDSIEKIAKSAKLGSWISVGLMTGQFADINSEMLKGAIEMLLSYTVSSASAFIFF